MFDPFENPVLRKILNPFSPLNWIIWIGLATLVVYHYKLASSQTVVTVMLIAAALSFANYYRNNSDSDPEHYMYPVQGTHS